MRPDPIFERPGRISMRNRQWAVDAAGAWQSRLGVTRGRGARVTSTTCSRTTTGFSCTLLVVGLLLSGCTGEPENLRETNAASSPTSSTPAPLPPTASGADGWALERWAPEIVKYGDDLEPAVESVYDVTEAESAGAMSAAALRLSRVAGEIHDRLSDRIATNGQPPDEFSARVTSLLRAAEVATRAGNLASDACAPDGDTEAISTECRNAYKDAATAGSALEGESLSLLQQTGASAYDEDAEGDDTDQD